MSISVTKLQPATCENRAPVSPPALHPIAMSETFDAILIGAGPAGSAASAILAEYGHRVLVMEREKFPRYHIGESLIPFTFGPLERLGMIPKMRSSHFVKKY